MEDPQMYHRENTWQMTDAKAVISQHFGLFKWDQLDCKVVDIGCGNGDVTRKVLFPNLPQEKISSIVGLDISSSMVEYALKNNGHEKISYIQFNIANKENSLPAPNKFTHAFSFHCLHWIKDHESCLRNIYNLMEDKGQLLFNFSSWHPDKAAYDKMGLKPRWKPYMHGVEELYWIHRDKEAGKKFKNIAENVGFEVKLFDIQDKIFKFPSKNKMKEAYKAIDIFASRMPENEREAYFTELMDEIENEFSKCVSIKADEYYPNPYINY